MAEHAGDAADRRGERQRGEERPTDPAGEEGFEDVETRGHEEGELPGEDVGVGRARVARAVDARIVALVVGILGIVQDAHPAALRLRHLARHNIIHARPLRARQHVRLPVRALAVAVLLEPGDEEVRRRVVALSVGMEIALDLAVDFDHRLMDGKLAAIALQHGGVLRVHFHPRPDGRLRQVHRRYRRLRSLRVRHLLQRVEHHIPQLAVELCTRYRLGIFRALAADKDNR